MASPFFWLDLLTPDPDAAAAFYADVCGWSVRRSGGLLGLSAGDTPVAAVQRLHDEAAPHWIGHLAVPDVATACRRMTFVQGSVLLEPEELEGLGVQALVADPVGAVLQLFQPATDTRVQRPSGAPGTLAWSTLFAPRPDLGGRVYRTVLGWKGRAGPPPGLDDDDGPVADLIDAGKEPPVPPQWFHHIAVPDLAEALARADDADCEVLRPPGPRGALLIDPWGAGFGLIQAG